MFQQDRQWSWRQHKNWEDVDLTNEVISCDHQAVYEMWAVALRTSILNDEL